MKGITNTMRYEIKYMFTVDRYDEIIQSILTNPYIFKEIYAERQINNIYIDTSDFRFYHANLSGDSKRHKMRIRWYGELNSYITRPKLEIKKKVGHVGSKTEFFLESFTFNSSFSYLDYKKELVKKNQENFINDIEYCDFLTMNPAIVNRYKRRYFGSACSKFRITLDTDIWYYSIENALRDKLFGTLDRHIILEVKFDEKDRIEGGLLLNKLKYRIYKYSKYVKGVQAVYNNSNLES